MSLFPPSFFPSNMHVEKAFLCVFPTIQIFSAFSAEMAESCCPSPQVLFVFVNAE